MQFTAINYYSIHQKTATKISLQFFDIKIDQKLIYFFFFLVIRIPAVVAPAAITTITTTMMIHVAASP